MLNEETWQEFEDQMIDKVEWAKGARVSLEPDQTQNIARLHEKLALARTWHTSIRDVILDAMLMQTEVKKDLLEAEIAFQKYSSNFYLNPPEDAKYKGLKTKEERELYMQSNSNGIYEKLLTWKSRLERTEDYIKQLYLVYYSVNGAREDVTTQVSILKQQMYSGEVKPSKDFLELPPALAGLLGQS